MTTIGDCATRAPLHYAWHGASPEAPPPPLRDGQRGRNSANPVCTAYCATASQALPLSAVGEGKLLKRREKAGNMEAERLKLLAVDNEDLAVLSAHVQDAILKVADLVYLPKEKRFVVGMNRFIWEKADGQRRNYERRRAALTFDRVKAVQGCQICRDRPDAVLELLAVSFEPVDAPAGYVTLYFAGGGKLRFEVECLEVRLADLGVAWATMAKPVHDIVVETA